MSTRAGVGLCAPGVGDPSKDFCPEHGCQWPWRLTGLSHHTGLGTVVRHYLLTTLSAVRIRIKAAVGYVALRGWEGAGICDGTGHSECILFTTSNSAGKYHPQWSQHQHPWHYSQLIRKQQKKGKIVNGRFNNGRMSFFKKWNWKMRLESVRFWVAHL